MFLDAGYDVSEAAVDVLFPLLSGLTFVHNWELNAAFRRIQTGNPSLVPEVVDTFTAGFVLQRRVR
jgi:hypothetical protein